MRFGKVRMHDVEQQLSISTLGTQQRLTHRLGRGNVVGMGFDPRTRRHDHVWLQPLDDVLAADWIRRTLQNLAACRSAELTGCVSMLYAGDKPVAGHLGIASQGAWHYWFPAYDRDFAKYSTGLSLLVQMLKSAGAGRPSVIDFGKGDQRYKEQLKTGDRVIASGSVELAGPLRFRRTVRRLIAGVPGSRELRDFVKRQVHGRVASPHK